MVKFNPSAAFDNQIEQMQIEVNRYKRRYKTNWDFVNEKQKRIDLLREIEKHYGYLSYYEVWMLAEQKINKMVAANPRLGLVNISLRVLSTGNDAYPIFLDMPNFLINKKS